MKKSVFGYATIKSHFHGGGIHSRHRTARNAAKEARKWGAHPGLAVAVLDFETGRYHRVLYEEGYNTGEFRVYDESVEPIPTICEHPFPSARDYLI